MGLIDRAIGGGGGGTLGSLGEAAEGLSEVFVPNATRALELAAEVQRATLQAASAEFQHAGTGWFDRLVNGMNRLPRPMLALGTLGLFVYAMADPAGFSDRMLGLQEVPEPLWWLLGAVVSFYFGARELHYSRIPGLGAGRRGDDGGGGGRPRAGGRIGDLFRRGLRRGDEGAAPAGARPGAVAPDNPALSEWRSAD